MLGNQAPACPRECFDRCQDSNTVILATPSHSGMLLLNMPTPRRASLPRRWPARCAPRACAGHTSWLAASAVGPPPGWRCARAPPSTMPPRWTRSVTPQRRVGVAVGPASDSLCAFPTARRWHLEAHRCYPAVQG